MGITISSKMKPLHVWPLYIVTVDTRDESHDDVITPRIQMAVIDAMDCQRTEVDGSTPSVQLFMLSMRYRSSNK